MIRIDALRNYCNGLGVLISADKVLYVVREDHLQRKLAGAAGLFLCVVLPSAQTTGGADAVVDVNTVLLYVLRNHVKADSTDESELDDYAAMQYLASSIKLCIIADADAQTPPMAFLDRRSITIDPEWNVAGGYNGYSITFEFIDNE